jgi:DNA-binding transcriptional regulator YiaG
MTMLKRKCRDCGKVMNASRENYHYTQCGLNSVNLKNILVFHCECGAVVPEIPNVAGLHRRIVLDVLKKGSLLSGEEIRFLRKMSGFNCVELSRLMGVHPVTVSRWENNSSNIGPSNDRVLRLICFTGLMQSDLKHKAGEFVEEVASVAKQSPYLNIKSILERIEERSEGSKTVTIDPTLLSGFGSPEEEAVLSSNSVLN